MLKDGRDDEIVMVVFFTLTLRNSVFKLTICNYPQLYQTLSELVDPENIKESSSLFRFLTHFLSYMVVLVNPTIYTLQYPTIKESLMKRELLKFK